MTRLGREFRTTFLAALTWLSTGGIAAGSCLTCHTGMIAGKVVHSPVAASDCTACHLPPTVGGHPGGTGKVVLTEKEGKLCLLCHESKATAKFVHAPVAAGSCTACHDPHRAELRYLLKLDGAPLCFQCHEDVSRQAFSHAPVAAGECLSCHDPHQSNSRFLLKKPSDHLCLSCHKNGPSDGKVIHAPLKKGGCVSCHRPHGSAFRKLLKANYASEMSLAYDSRNFDLCFECHNKDMLLDPQTELSTQFRNGFKNLHIVHVISPVRGRNCKVCHDSHDSNQDMLINESVPGFGKWKIPIAYRKTDTGGTCVVGCHKPRSYSRATEVNYR